MDAEGGFPPLPGRGSGKATGLLAVALLVALWKLGAMATGADIILPPPEKVLASFLRLFGSAGFLRALGATALRGLAAFALSMLIGSVAGALAGSSRFAAGLMAPAMTVIRATPVMAIILLALIWFPDGFVPVFSAVVMAFPVVMANVAAGIRAADPKLLQMARLFGMGRGRAAMRIRLPSAMPHLVAGAGSALGLSWKVVVAGEALSQPRFALGAGMQAARIMLETTEVFAWAAAGILLCALSDACFNLLSRRLSWPTA